MSFREIIESVDYRKKDGKRVLYKEPGQTTSVSGEYRNPMADPKSIAGFVATKANIAEGYAIYLPNKEEVKEFGKDALRVVWSKGTSIVKINAIKGQLIWLDNQAYEKGELKWQSPMAYDRVVIDDSENGAKLQSIIGIKK